MLQKGKVMFLKKHATKIILAIIVALFAIIGCLGFVGAGASPSTSNYTGDSSKLGYYDGYVYSVDFSSEENEGVSPERLWINFGSLDLETKKTENKITIRVGFATSEYGYFTEAIALNNGAVENVASKVKVGQWQFLASYPSTFDEFPDEIYFVVATNAKVRINEIALTGVDTEGKIVKLGIKAEGGGFKGESTSATAWKNSLEDTKTATSAFASINGIAKAKVLIDEQNTFNVNAVSGKDYKNAVGNALTEREYYTLEGIKAFSGNADTYADKSIGGFGTAVLSLGASVFGFNAFGIRFTSLLFSIATLFVAYALGKIIFKNVKGAILFVFLLAVGGLSLGLATVGTADAIAVFFALLSFTFMFKFKKQGVDAVSPLKSFLYVLFSGISFAFAVSTLSRMIFVLPALLFLFVYTLVVFIKENKNKQETLEDVSRISILGSLITILSFIIVPFIITGVVVMARFNYFSAHYNTTNLFAIIVKLLFGGIYNATAIAGNGYNSLGWLINFGAEVMGPNKAIFGNIVLTIVNLLAFGFGLVLILKPLAKKQKLSKGFINSYVVPFITLTLIWLFTVIGGLIGAVNGISAFYIGQIALSATTVLSLLRLKISNDSSSIGTINLAKKRKVAACVLGAMLLVAVLASTALVGLGYFSPIYCFNVLNGGLI